MVFVVAKIVHWVFLGYTILLFARLLGSWVPQLAGHKLMRFVTFYTDPYLNIFRKFIPPIGGRIDLSPIVAFFALDILQKVVMSVLGGLL